MAGRDERLLSVRGLEVEYSTTGRAVHGVDLDVPRGAAVALLGANGAGKTTLVRAITGMLRGQKGRIVSGSVEVGDVAVTRMSARRIVQAGVAQVPEGRLIFGRLTVRENLLCGAAARRKTPELKEDLEKVWQLFPRIYPRRDSAAGLLSGGEQQMVAVGRALMGRPRLLICDEVTLGLAPKFVTELFETLGAIKRDLGTSMLLVEQNVEVALALASYAYVLAGGVVALEGSSSELRASAELHRSYLGEVPSA